MSAVPPFLGMLRFRSPCGTPKRRIGWMSDAFDPRPMDMRFGGAQPGPIADGVRKSP